MFNELLAERTSTNLSCRKSFLSSSKGRSRSVILISCNQPDANKTVALIIALVWWISAKELISVSKDQPWDISKIAWSTASSLSLSSQNKYSQTQSQTVDYLLKKCTKIMYL